MLMPYKPTWEELKKSQKEVLKMAKKKTAKAKKSDIEKLKKKIMKWSKKQKPMQLRHSPCGASRNRINEIAVEEDIARKKGLKKIFEGTSSEFLEGARKETVEIIEQRRRDEIGGQKK